MQEKFLEKNRSNYSSNIKNFGRKLGVNVKEGALSIHKFVKGEKYYEFWVNSNIIIENIQNSYFFYLIEINKNTGLSTRNLSSETPLPILQKKSCQGIMEICPLFRDFYENDIPYSHKQLLASNLVHVKSGKKFFFGGLKNTILDGKSNGNILKLIWAIRKSAIRPDAHMKNSADAEAITINFRAKSDKYREGLIISHWTKRKDGWNSHCGMRYAAIQTASI